MSSHGGQQQNFPFGCMAQSYFSLRAVPFAYVSVTDQPENIHGMGLPEFMTPGPPPGQPLLNAHENQDLNNFFHDFESNAATNKPFSGASFHNNTGPDQFYGMPPMFVGSDTALSHRSVIDPHQLQSGGGFPYNDGMMGHAMNTAGQPAVLDGHIIQGTAYGDAGYHNPLMAQLQTAASMQPAFGPAWQQQAFNTPAVMDVQPQGRQVVTFGTDSRFQPTGYAAPNNPTDPDLPQAMRMHPMDWFEATSASTSQANTRPNTEPSSPNWPKKRTFDDFRQDQPPRNGTVLYANGQPSSSGQQTSPPPSTSRRKRDSVVKREPATTASSQPVTPLSNSKTHTPLNVEIPAKVEAGDHDEDAEAEEDDGDGDATTEPPKSPSPAPWPSSKARPPRNTNPPPPKPSRKKKVTPNSSAPVKLKAKSPRTPSGSQANNASSRTPLTIEQKKANHTTSEQRRRDATARAYAELYDLVPELEDLGKQSTMKKLEVVVDKVRRTKQTVELLRSKLGLDPLSGRPITTVSGDAGGVVLHDVVPGWPQ
jgi:hypothetical protein